MALLKKKSRFFRVICGLLAVLLVQSNLEQVQAQGTPFLPSPHSYFVDLSAPFSLPVLRGMRVYPNKPFEFDFVVDSGDKRTLDQKATSLLIKYFLTCLTIPEQDLWVNLSPYESGRIIPNELALTNAGNTLLEQDKLLKQLASSLTYPESRLGKIFWEQVYKKAYQRFGTTNLPVNTYNKVWIVPDRAIVYDMGDSAFIGDTHLKVMLEEDYLAMAKNRRQPGDMALAVSPSRLPSKLGLSAKATQGENLTQSITKEIILPELEKEINEGKNFAPVRQIFHSMVLAAWFKRALRRSVLNDFYANKKKISGIDGVDKNAKEEIYKQYLRIYKVGAYNYIREDVDPITQQVVPRKYFSGGLFFGDLDKAMKTLRVFGGLKAISPYLDEAQNAGDSYGVAKVILNPIGFNPIGGLSDAAQLALPSFMKKFVSTVALAVTLHSPQQGRSLQAQQLAQTPTPAPAPIVLSGQAVTAPVHVLHFGDNITPADQEDIQRIKKVVHLEDVIALNQGSNPQTHRKYDVDIPWMARNWDASFTRGYEGRVLEAIIVAAQHKYNLPEDGRLGEDTRKAITAAFKGVEPQGVAPTPPAPVEQKITHAVKQFYSVSQTAAAIPVEDHVVAKSSGIITGLDPDKKEYQAGETIFVLNDLDLTGRIESVTAELQIQENKLAELEALFDAQAASDQEVTKAKQNVQDLRQQLAKANQERANDVVTAPHKLTIKDIQVADGMSVPKGTQLLSYYDDQRVRVDLEVPVTVNYFNDVALTLDGNPVESIISHNWTPAPSPEKARVSFVVVTTSPVVSGQKVEVSAKIYYPDKDKILDAIVGKGRVTVAVGRVEEYPLTAPAAGAVSFLAQEGDNVKAGQVLAQVDTKPYQEQLDKISQGIKDIDDQLSQAVPPADGTQFVGREEVDQLKIQRAQLLAQGKTLQEQIARSQVRAPYSGVIAWSAAPGSGIFQNQDMLFRINTGTVFLGDINSTNNAILFSRGVDIKTADPVLVETPQGVRLLGQVTGVNKSPYSPAVELTQVQSVEVKVNDPQHTLRPGLPVQVTLLTEKEKQTALALLSANSRTQFVSASSPPPPPDPLHEFASQLFAPNTNAPSINPSVPQAYFSPQGPSLNPTQLEQQVLGNPLLTADEASDYLEKRLAENLPGDKSFGLTAGVWRSGNGQVSYLGGFGGALNNIAGNLYTGNAINPLGAGLDILLDLSGKIMDHFTNKIGKEKALAGQVTLTAYNVFQSARYQQVNHANKLLINIGAAEQRIAQMQGLARDLEEARKVMIAREPGGFSLTGDRLKLEQSISDAKMQISDLQGKVEAWTVEVNASADQPRTDLHKAFSANLPWAVQSFPSISKDQEAQWLEELTGDNSPDPRMQAALNARKVMEKTMELQRLKKLPAVNFAGVFTPSDDSGLKNSIFEPLGGEVWRVSTMAPGSNPTLQVDIPIVDKKLKTLDQILGVEKQKTESKIEKTKLDLAEELGRTAGNIRNLSDQIQHAQEAYENAVGAWKLKAARPDLYLPPQLVPEREAMDQKLGEVTDLKARYMAEEANLRQMQLLKQGQSLIKDQAMAVDRAQAARASFFQKFALAVALIVTPLAVVPLAAQGGEAQVQAGISFGDDASSAWALMRGGGLPGSSANLQALKSILIGDPNILTRRAALKHFLNEYQNNPGFIQSLQEIIMASPYQDVVQELFRYMTALKDHDLRFFIQMISKAEMENKHGLAALAYQSLEDVLTDDPGIFEHLLPTSFIADGSSLYPNVSQEIAKKVFLTWLAADPVDSIAKTRFLQSKYWSSEERAKIYNELMANKMNNLAGLIYDSILRDKALENIDQIFSLGPYEKLSGLTVWHGDMFSFVRIQELADQNRLFLTVSPQWRGMKQYIHPGLYAKAEKETQGIIADNPAASNGSGPIVYDFSDLQGQASSSLNYFLSLGLSDQKDYIAKSQNSELARILQSPTPLRAVVLDRLMASRDGRLLALNVYLGSTDPGLLELIEARNWLGTMKPDGQDIESSAANRIFRGALVKMYGRTKEGWLLNVLLGNYSPLELYSVQDARGEAPKNAQIRLVAMEWAVKSFEEETHYRPVLWAGYGSMSPEELNLMGNITREIKFVDDPRELDAYLGTLQANTANSGIKKTLRNLMSDRDTLAEGIKNNDQGFSRFTISTKIISVVIISSILFVAGSLLKIFFNLGVKHRNSDVKTLLNDFETDLPDKEVKRNGKNGNGSNGNGKNGHGDKAMIIPVISQVDVYKPVFGPLQSWRNLVDRWSKQDQYSAEALLSDFNTILNNAAEMLRLMPYSPDLMWSNENRPLNEDYQKSYYYFQSLATRSLDKLSDRLKGMDLTEVQRLRFLQDKDDMLGNMRYVSRYLRILKYRGIIERVMNYKLPDNNWREAYGFGPYVLARVVLLYQLLWNSSEKKLRKELPLLLADGNSLMPGFYENPNAIVQESEERLKDVTWGGKTAYNPLSQGDRRTLKMRSFNSRMMNMLPPAQIFITGLLAFSGIVELSPEVLILSVLSALWTISLFWVPHLQMLAMRKDSVMKLIMDKLNSRLNGLLDPSGRYKNAGDPEQRIEDLIKQEGAQEVKTELALPVPRVDAIVIIAEEKNDVNGLQEYVRGLRGRLIRNDIPVEVLSPKFKGSGNAYLEALLMIKKEFETSTHQEQYPHLKPWENARVMFVFHGEDSRQDARIDWGITNGYRAAAGMSPAGNIIIYDRDPYYGPIQEVKGSDITISTSRVRRDDLKGLGWVNTDFSRNGDAKVHEVLEKLDIQTLLEQDQREPRGAKTIKHLRDRLYDLSNRFLKQFSAFNGIVLMGPGAVNMFTKIAGDLENSGLREKLRQLHLTSDMLIPLAIGRELDGDQWERETDDYVAERARWPDMTEGNEPNGARNGKLEAIKTALKEFYYIIGNAVAPSIKISSFVPHPRAEIYIPDGASAAKSPGGIDLNFQPQFIQRPSAAGFTGIQEANVPNMPDGFKGFSFNIVRFTSQLTANSAFQLMFTQ